MFKMHFQKWGGNSYNAYDKELTSYIKKECTQTKNKKVNLLKSGQSIRTGRLLGSGEIIERSNSMLYSIYVNSP